MSPSSSNNPIVTLRKFRIAEERWIGRSVGTKIRRVEAVFRSRRLLRIRASVAGTPPGVVVRGTRTKLNRGTQRKKKV